MHAIYSNCIYKFSLVSKIYLNLPFIISHTFWHGKGWKMLITLYVVFWITITHTAQLFRLSFTTRSTWIIMTNFLILFIHYFSVKTNLGFPFFSLSGGTPTRHPNSITMFFMKNFHLHSILNITMNLGFPFFFFREALPKGNLTSSSCSSWRTFTSPLPFILPWTSLATSTWT